MSLVDRLLRRPAHGSDPGTWNDEGVDSVVELTTTMATAWDADPGDPRAGASRAAVLGAFARAPGAQAVHVEARAVASRPVPPAGAAPRILRGGRRPALALVAAGLLLAVSLGTVVASAAGGPLYEARISAEALFLPGTPDDRAAAQVARLDARLAEASGAMARGDTGAADQALRAYARIATEGAAGSPAGATVAGDLARRVRAQLAILAALGTGDPALEDARESAMLAARAMLGALAAPDGGPGPGSGPATPLPTGSGSAPSTPRGNEGLGSSLGPGGTPGPNPTGGPGGPAGSHGPTASPHLGATTTPASSSGPIVQPTPRPAPHASGGPSGSSGGGATPRPSSGGGGDAGAITDPGARP
jgi:hypothetical protein